MTFSKLRHRLSRGSILLSVFLLYNSCGPKFPAPTATQTMTITLSGVFAGCHNPLSSSAPIPYTGTVLVSYYDASGRNPRQGDFQTFTTGTNPATDVVVTVHVPVKNFFDLDIIAQATACSTCAPTQIGPWTCIQTASGSGMSAAKPKYEKQTGIWTTHPSAVTFTSANWMHLADPNSCGCVVPN